MKRTILDSVFKEIKDKKEGNFDILQSKLNGLPEQGWKDILMVTLKQYLASFDSPKFNAGNDRNLRNLFSRYLDIEMTQKLIEKGIESEKIDNIVRIRGDIAHRGETLNALDRLTADRLAEYLQLVTCACAIIEISISEKFRSHFNFAPWQITKRINACLEA